jgi:hypothetical protein
MSFFGVPSEIRLKIYSELLVHSEPIVFVADDDGPPAPPLFRSKRDGLCPALLRVNKKVHSEASPLLYSNNRFRFPDIFTSTPSATNSPHIAPFLRQIGSQASLIRHICITFPTDPQGCIVIDSGSDVERSKHRFTVSGSLSDTSRSQLFLRQ